MGQFSTPLMYALGAGVFIFAMILLAAYVNPGPEPAVPAWVYGAGALFFFWLGSGFMHVVGEPALTWPDWPFLKLKDQTWGGDDDDDM